uniref:NADH dehydrogenase [ubiquinone] 1 alpha subcomplex subunit 12 n=1 Tax=Strongyloides papillosus TaxID=174720 RepID=A0A0N5CDK9_STREA
MSRPGVWTTVWRNFIGSITRSPKREYIAEDHYGNKYYVVKQGKHAKSRGYEPPESGSRVEPSNEWAAWLKGTRRFPPSEKELAINEIRQQAQFERNNMLEKSAPQVDSTDKENLEQKSSFPTYKNYEVAPGYNPDEKK